MDLSPLARKSSCDQLTGRSHGTGTYEQRINVLKSTSIRFCGVVCDTTTVHYDRGEKDDHNKVGHMHAVEVELENLQAKAL